MPQGVVFQGLPHVQSPDEILSTTQIEIETKEQCGNQDKIDITTKFIENLTKKKKLYTTNN